MFRYALAIFLLIPLPVSAQLLRFDPEASRQLAGTGRTLVSVTLRDTCAVPDASSSRRQVSLAESQAPLQESHGGESIEQRCARYSTDQDRLLARLPAEGCIVRHRYRHAPGMLLEIANPQALEILAAAPEVEAIDLDTPGSGGLEESRVLIHANEVFDLGIKGSGRIVAVLDSGADTDHPDLETAIIYQYHFLNQGFDKGAGAEDEHGHGTNVTGILASQGTVAPRGIAPGASIVAIRVLDESNRGWVADWTAGFDHILKLHRGEIPGMPAIPIDAINMSLVTNAEFSSECDSSFQALSSLCRTAKELGIAVFASSGNTSSSLEMTSPACIASVIAVGSVTDVSGTLSSFTSRNQFLDLLAPGQVITSTGLDGGLSSFQGTSQASPHAAALACILREVQPHLSPDEILEILQETGLPLIDLATGKVFPRIDALAAVRQVVLKVGGLSCILQSDPHRMQISWNPVSGAESSLLEIQRNGEFFLQEVMAGEAASYEFAPEEGGEYRICVSRMFLSISGLPACCTIQFPDPPKGPRFVRSDCDGSRIIDLSDAMTLLNFLFLGIQPGFHCDNACDANGSGELDLSDAVFTLIHLFLGGLTPPPPFPGCGVDETPDLSCEMPTCG